MFILHFPICQFQLQDKTSLWPEYRPLQHAPRRLKTTLSCSQNSTSATDDLLLLYFFSNSVECTDYLYKQIEPTNTFPDIPDFLGLRSLLGLRLKQKILCIDPLIVAEQDKQVSIITNKYRMVVIYFADYMYMAARQIVDLHI